MGRNLYILGGTFGALALLCFGISFTGVAQQGGGAPGDVGMWRMMGWTLLLVSLVVLLLGMMSSLFAQAERRHEEQRLARRRNRS